MCLFSWHNCRAPALLLLLSTRCPISCRRHSIMFLKAFIETWRRIETAVISYGFDRQIRFEQQRDCVFNSLLVYIGNIGHSGLDSVKDAETAFAHTHNG